MNVDPVHGNPIAWLLEVDPANPGVRYFALTDLLDRPADDPDVMAARCDLMTTGPVPIILDAQSAEGYWVKPGGGYTPSYRATVWQIIFLAELGADSDDARVRRGCEYLLDHSIAASGGFSIGVRPIPSKVVHCLNGELLWALSRLGRAADARLQAAVEWEVDAIAGDDSIRYYRSGTTGPGFACVANAGLPCAWGATKALKGLVASTSSLPRAPTVSDAIEKSVELLLGHDLTVADYPCADQISRSWFRFGFPLSYRSDVLEAASALAAAGYGRDPRLANALALVQSKQDSQGRWVMERTLNGKMWVDIEARGKPSKWVTLRALRLFKCLQSGDLESTSAQRKELTT